jgi:hypothetical protein
MKRSFDGRKTLANPESQVKYEVSFRDENQTPPEREPRGRE